MWLEKNNELPFIYKLIETTKAYISEPIYLFSDEIKEISINELKNGKIITTYGTNFDCVVLHAINNNFKKILVITDGIGPMKEENIRYAKDKNMEVFVIITQEEKEFDNPWEKIAKKIWVIRKN